MSTKFFSQFKIAVAVFGAFVILIGCSGNDDHSIDLPPPQILTYVITFDANGGVISPASGTTDTNGKLTTLPVPIRPDYTFDGWSTAPTEGTVVDTSTVFNANVTIYALWTAMPTYTITFDVNDGSVSETSGLTGTNGKLMTLPKPTRPDYTFDGWFTAPTDGAVVDTSTVFNANVTIYAQWTAMPIYTITFDANGGIISETSGMTSTNGKLAILPTPTRVGYTFNGWFSASIGGIAVDTNRIFREDATIYARWTVISVTFNPTNGTVTPASSTTNEDGKLGTLPIPVRERYVFEGWFMEVTGGVAVDTNTVFTLNDTVYARWTSGGTQFNPAIAYDFFTDTRDYQTYRTIVVGGKRWMAENLNYQTAGGSYCYNNSLDSCVKYGRLYVWNVAVVKSTNENYNSMNPNGRQGVCPVGWHLPTSKEWDDLMRVAGGKHIAGIMLKSQTGWIDRNGETSGNGTDYYGFSALPGGERLSSAFDGVGNLGYWWHSEFCNACTTSSAFMTYMAWAYDDADRSSSFINFAHSVRCIED